MMGKNCRPWKIQILKFTHFHHFIADFEVRESLVVGAIVGRDGPILQAGSGSAGFRGNHMARTTHRPRWTRRWMTRSCLSGNGSGMEDRLSASKGGFRS